MAGRHRIPSTSVRIPTDLVVLATRIAGARTVATGRHVTPAHVLADAARAHLADAVASDSTPPPAGAP
ncbi:MAG: hypothetical protein ACHREM_29070 [Polyangiales bacterium]